MSSHCESSLTKEREKSSRFARVFILDKPQSVVVRTGDSLRMRKISDPHRNNEVSNTSEYLEHQGGKNGHFPRRGGS